MRTLLLLVLASYCIHVSAHSAERRGEFIPLTVNSLAQARFFQPRRQEPRISAKHGIHAVCEHGKIGLAVNPFKEGRIYASHKETDAECIQYSTTEKDWTRFATPIDGSCGVRINRKESGIEYRLRIVVSHSTDQLTEEDRIYDVICRFSSKNASVSAAHDTVGLRAGAVRLSVAAPQCKYSLHLNDPDGPQAVSARIGAKVFHKWSCAAPDEYAFRVYGCSAHNGLDKAYTIIDERGCSLDEKILPQLEYDLNRGIAYVQAKAFRLSNSRRIHFNCLVAICHRWDQQCMKGVPPRCESRTQQKRDLSHFEEEQVEEEEEKAPSLTLSTEELVLSTEDGCGGPWLAILCIANMIALLSAFMACLWSRSRITPSTPKSARHFKF